MLREEILEFRKFKNKNKERKFHALKELIQLPRLNGTIYSFKEVKYLTLMLKENMVLRKK